MSMMLFAVLAAGCGGGEDQAGGKAATQKFINIATGGTAGTYYPLGGAKLNFGATLAKESDLTKYQIYTESTGGLNGSSAPITVKGGAYCLLTNSAQPLEVTRYLLKMLWSSG